MKNTPNVQAERYRIRSGQLATNSKDGNNGGFRVPQKNGPDLLVIISDGQHPADPYHGSWEHVSVSTSTRCPTWDEMSRIKDLFFREDEVVVQFHPARSNYVNDHPYCLHLWRNRDWDFEMPPKVLVGPGLNRPKPVRYEDPIDG